MNLQHDNNIIKIENQKMSLIYSNVDFNFMLYHYSIIIMRFDQHNIKSLKKWRFQSNYIDRINTFKFKTFINCLNSTSSEFISINQRSFSSQKHQSKCRRCKQIFDSNNQLHSHLASCHIKTHDIFAISIRRRDLIDSWRRF